MIYVEYVRKHIKDYCQTHFKALSHEGNIEGLKLSPYTVDDFIHNRVNSSLYTVQIIEKFLIKNDASFDPTLNSCKKLLDKIHREVVNLKKREALTNIDISKKSDINIRWVETFLREPTLHVRIDQLDKLCDFLKKEYRYYSKTLREETRQLFNEAKKYVNLSEFSRISGIDYSTILDFDKDTVNTRRITLEIINYSAKKIIKKNS